MAASTVLRVLAATVLGTVIGCDTTPDHLRRDIQERRLHEAGIESVDPSGQSPEAGLSVLRNIEVDPIDTRKLGSDTASLGFQRLIHRCGTCHSAPSPKLRTSAQWKTIFSRMDKHMTEAGLIPLADEDQALILEFLQRNAKGR